MAAEAEPATEVVEADKEADAEPTTVGAARTIPDQKSILPPTQGGQVPDIQTCLPSARAGSTGIGGSQRDSVKNHGRVHGKISSASLQRMDNNETKTSPYRPCVTKYTIFYTKTQKLRK